MFYPRFKSPLLKSTSLFKHALPLSVGEFADANEFALVAANGDLLLCSVLFVCPLKWFTVAVRLLLLLLLCTDESLFV